MAANALSSPLQELPDIPAMLINTAVSTLTLQAASSQQGQRCLLPKTVIPPTILLQTAKYFLLNKNRQSTTTSHSFTDNHQSDPVPPPTPPRTSAEASLGPSKSSDVPCSLVSPSIDLSSLITPLDVIPSNTRAFNPSTFSSFAKSLVNLDPMMTVNQQQQQYPEQLGQTPCPSDVSKTNVPMDESPVINYTPRTSDLPLDSEALLALADNLLHNMSVEGLMTTASTQSPLGDPTTFHSHSSSALTTADARTCSQTLSDPNIVSDDADHYSLPVNGIRLVNQFSLV